MEDGSSFSAGFYPYRNRGCPTDSSNRKQKERRSIRQDYHGNMVTSNRKSPETTSKLPEIIGNHTVFQTQKSNTSIMTTSDFFLTYAELDLPEFCFPLFTITRVFRFDFPSDFTRSFDGISHGISTRYRIGFRLRFRADFNGISTRICPVFRQYFY